MAEAALSIAFLGIQAFLWFAWWCFVRSQASGLATAEVILCSTVLYFAHIIGTSLVLGWAGFLARGPLVLLTLLSAAGVLVLALRPSARHRVLAELIDLASHRPNTLLFLPHRSAAYAYYASDPDQFREAFSNEHVTVATAR